jgi:hypothetical protein
VTERQTRMRWEVRVEGPRPILIELAKTLTGDLHLVQRDGVFVICGPVLDELDDAASVRSTAERIVTALSGIAKLAYGSAETLSIGSVKETRPDGGENISIEIPPAILRMSGTVSRSVIYKDGSVEEVADDVLPVTASLERALTDPAVAKALRLRNAADLNFADLVRLYEVIETAVGGEKAVVTRFRVSANMIERF